MLTLAREAATGERVVLVANLTAIEHTLPSLVLGARALLDSADPRFGGVRGEPLRPYQAVLFEVE